MTDPASQHRTSSLPALRGGFFLWMSAASILAWAGCAPSVQITTPEPLKVDITMKVDVQQNNPAVISASRKLSDAEVQAQRRRDDRSGEIWAMKNDGVAIEGRQGYLEAKTKSGWDPSYVHRLVSEENQDRRMVYQAEAAESARPLSAIETEAGRRFRAQAYGGGTNHLGSSTGALPQP